ncbi:MAG: PEP-CTERM sorting domain-containing protein [Chthoniobacteraceae bacterium]
MLKTLSTRRLLLATLPLLVCSTSVSAHLGYGGRDFGSFSGLEPQTSSIDTQTVVNWSWADGTDADFMHSHKLKFFRFTLDNPATVIISVQSLDVENMLPGFSIYSGLAHLSPAPADYENAVTMDYLATLDGPPKEGAFNALATWKIGNDASLGVADFSTFTYIGHAADGTSLNYGPVAGINGDGLADGLVSSSFALPAGSYTLAVGGAIYDGQGSEGAIFEGGHTNANLTAYGMEVKVAAVPEPSSAMLLAIGMLAVSAARRRSSPLGVRS